MDLKLLRQPLAAFFILAGLLSAQEVAEPGLLRPIPPSQQVNDAPRARRSRYLIDLSQIKHATLESEPVFFERMEKENKLEAMETLITDAKTRLQSVRRSLLPPGMDQLQDSAQTSAQARETLDAVAKSLNAARADLRDYHQRTTPQARAIAAGRSDAVPLLGKMRREIRAAEHGLGSLKEFTFVDVQKKLEDAHKNLSKTIQPLQEDDPSRPKLQQAVADLERATAALNEAMSQASDLIELLEKTRRQYLPECSSADTVVLRPMETDRESEQPSATAGACPNLALALLNQSLPVLEALDKADANLTELRTAVLRVKDSATEAIKRAEEADAASQKQRGEARERGAEAERLLEQVEDRISDIREFLTGDCPEQTTTCENCGKILARTRPVMDPTAACARAEQPLRQAEETINQAREQAEEMEKLLAQVKPSDDPVQNARLSLSIRELHGDRERHIPGVAGSLALAVERGQQFRDLRFEFYPSQAYATEIAAAQPRAFPPMKATYVAREEWHYPAYFEDINVERYGNRVPLAQPFLSYGKFLADLAWLPYKVWLDRPYERQYTLGLYRPGDEVPFMIYLPEPNLGAAAFEAGVWTGLIFFP